MLTTDYIEQLMNNVFNIYKNDTNFNCVKVSIAEKRKYVKKNNNTSIHVIVDCALLHPDFSNKSLQHYEYCEDGNNTECVLSKRLSDKFKDVHCEVISDNANKNKSVSVANFMFKE